MWHIRHISTPAVMTDTEFISLPTQLRKILHIPPFQSSSSSVIIDQAMNCGDTLKAARIVVAVSITFPQYKQLDTNNVAIRMDQF